MFTFKNFKSSSGLQGVGEAKGFDIKIKKKCVGYVTDDGWRGDGTLKLAFSVVDKERSSGFKWVFFKITKTTNLEEVKVDLKDKYDYFSTKYDFYFMED